MSDIAERYRRLAGAFEERIAAVPAERWEDPSPGVDDDPLGACGDAGEVEAVTAEARRFGDAFRSPGVCGPEVEVPADASPHDKLLAFYGRRP